VNELAEVATGESNITDYIEDYRDLSLSFDTMHLKENATFTADSSGVTDGTLLGDSFIQKYRTDLEDLIMTKTFTKEESAKYMCNPWALSYDLYESVEFWFLLLDLNNMYSATEFTQTTIQIYDGSLPDVVDKILAAEEPFIDNNTAEVDGTLNETDYDDSDDDSNIEESD
jgi:hypothetical protein